MTTTTTTAKHARTANALAMKASNRRNLSKRVDNAIERLVERGITGFTFADVKAEVKSDSCGGPVTAPNLRRILRRLIHSGNLTIVDIASRNAYVYGVDGSDDVGA